MDVLVVLELRRDTEEAAERATEKKLSRNPKSVWVSKKNADGDSVIEVVCNQIRLERKANGNLKQTSGYKFTYVKSRVKSQ